MQIYIRYGKQCRINKGIDASKRNCKRAGKKIYKKRFAYQDIFTSGKSFVGIAGLRGIGKTTILKQRLLESDNKFYISLDNFKTIDLYKITEVLIARYGIKELLLDEISYYKNWQQEFKKIYDRLEIKIYFTSSVAIDIVKAKSDLSRRVIVKELHPLSFREFIYFYKHKLIEKMDIRNINNFPKLQEISRFDYLFEEYVSGGLITAHLAEKDVAIFNNILERIIERDLVFSLNFDGKDIVNVKNMLEFIANSKVDDISYSSIARNIGISKYLSIKYVDALKKAFVLNVTKPKGSNITKEPKILFSPPFRLCYAKNNSIIENIGALREEFFVENARIANAEIFYLKGTRGEKKPDYEFNIENKKFVFEVSGKQKTRTQILKISENNRYILTQPSNIKNPYRPLLFIGFL